MGLATAEKVSISFPVANLIAFCVACVGLVLSLVWIMMAKGSKAWYEHYEKAIEAFELYNRCALKMDAPAKGIIDIHKETGFEKPETSSWLWNTKGGAYSVAKINIVIGHISAVIWIGLIVIHLVINQKGVKTSSEMMKFIEAKCDVSTMIFSFVIMLLLFWLYSNHSIRSSFLKDAK